MSDIQVGCALREHHTGCEPKLFGRIIFLSQLDDLVVIVRVPGIDKRGYQKNYIPRPLHRSLSGLQRQVDSKEWSVANFETPTHWLLTTEQLRQNSREGLLRPSRRRLQKWARKRSQAYGRIRPFVHGRSIEQIVMDAALAGWPAKRAKELGLVGCSQIQRDLNAYLLAMGLRSGLLPWYTNSGGPGKQKFSTTKTGRPKEFGSDDSVLLSGTNCDSHARMAFSLGWKKFKKPGVSEEQAFARTLNEWFCKSIRWDGTAAKVSLKPDALKYTVAQFAYWGKNNEEALTSLAIERGETAAKRNFMRRQGRVKDRYLSANSDAFLDSTSADQTLVSCASRLKVLSSPWRTDVMGASVDYIFGHHVGFESPSATTALMAILHAAEDKVEYCEKFGIRIKPRDWLAMTFRRFVMDNGEGKGQLAMTSLEEMESGASFGSAYDAINKSPVESGHRRIQRHVDHLMPASTMGRRARRGEPDRPVLARLNFYDYMPRLIERVLYHNNIERIVLPTVEMRRDDVEPTRRGVLEWMMAQGYVSSTPSDLQALRIRCLPRLKGCLQADGLHLYDPTFSGKRIIPHLTFTSDWLRSRVLAKASHARWHLDAHINPSDLSRVWVNLDGIKCLTLKTADPDMLQMTLLDWLAISRDDRLSGFLALVDKTKDGVNRVASIQQATKAANRERNEEIKARGSKPTKAEVKRDKRDNTAAEKAIHTGVPRPPVSKLSNPTRHTAMPSSKTTGSQEPQLSDLSDVINALRNL